MSYREKMICSILLLITLTSCVSGPFVEVTQSSYQAEENQDVTLEWTFMPRTDGSIKMNIYCEMVNDGRPVFLLHLFRGDEVSGVQDKRFAGRVKFDKDDLREGRLRLHMFGLRTDDSGVYLCGVFTGEGGGSETCRLNVTAERVQPKPETPNSSSGVRDPSQTGSPSQAESPGWIVLYCAVGLMMVGGTLLGGYYCLRRTHPMNPPPPAELDPMNLSS